MSSYLLIAYKPSSDDYCRGCHMGSYDSDFEKTVCDSLSDLIAEYVRFSTWHLSVNEEEYEISILDTNFEEVYLDDLGILDQVNEFTQKILEKRIDEAAEKKAAKRKKAEESQRKRELKQLEELKGKYE